MARKPRILVLNQYYKPGVEATANLLAALCEGLADEFDITVVTGRVHEREDLPAEEVVGGVRILRARSTAYNRTQLHHRAINYVTYLGDTLLRSLNAERPELVVCMTDPPIVGDLAVAVGKRFRAPVLVISQDVFPEIATELGRLQNPLLVEVLRRLVRFYLRRADHIVAIGERMRDRLIEKGAPPQRISIIPNWVDTTEIRPTNRNNTWARQQRLAGHFVVMHSGNVGHAQNLDNLIYAATFLRDLENLFIAIVGSGARYLEINRLIDKLNVPRAFHLGYQPREVLSESLSTGDIHYVGLAKGLAGYVVPSRLYGILAAARPVVVAADADSETARLVEEIGCGVVVPPDSPEQLAKVLRDAYQGNLDLHGMAHRGRTWVEREGDCSVAVERYRSLIRDVMAGGSVSRPSGSPDVQ